MRITKFFTATAFALVLSLTVRVSAQEIQGDTLYTSVVLPIILHFPERVTSTEYTQPSASGRFHSIIIGNALAIRAKQDNVKPAVLLVTEGSRKHSFILVYKKTLSGGELSHEWSNIKDLQKVAQAQEKRRAVDGITYADKPNKEIAVVSKKEELLKNEEKEKKYQPPLKETNNAGLGSIEKSKESPVATVETKPEDELVKKRSKIALVITDSVLLAEKKEEEYDSVISKANELIGQLDYAGAKEYFQQAHTLKPGEQLPLKMIAHVESAMKNLADRQRVKDSLQRIAQAREALAEANSEVLAKNWVRAKEMYQKVLYQKATPAEAEFARQKIEAIDIELARSAQMKGTQTAAKDQTPAKPLSIEQASFTGNNANTLKAITAGEGEKGIDQEKLLQRKIRINDWMDKGQQAFFAKNWDSARAYYKNAIDEFPSIDREKFARKKILEIELEIERQKGLSETEIESLKITKEAEDAQREQLTTDIMNKAQNAVLAKKWDSARIYYIGALTFDLTPSQEEFTRKKIETLDLEIAKRAARTNTQNTSVTVAKPIKPVEALPKPIEKIKEQTVSANPLSTQKKELKTIDTASNTKAGSSIAKATTKEPVQLTQSRTTNIQGQPGKQPLIDSGSKMLVVKNTPKPVHATLVPVSLKPADTLKAVVVADTVGQHKRLIDSVMAINQKNAEERRKAEELLLKRKILSSEWMDKGQMAFFARNWDSAKAYYNHAISLTSSVERQQFAQKKIAEIEQEIAKQKATALMVKVPVKKVEDTGKVVPAEIDRPNPGKAINKTVSFASRDSGIVSNKSSISQEAKTFTNTDTSNTPKLQATERLQNQATIASKMPDTISSVRTGTQGQISSDKLKDDIKPTVNTPKDTVAKSGKSTISLDTIASVDLVKKQQEEDRILQRKIQSSAWMDKGQQAILAKNWDSAKVYYNNAIALAPAIERQQYAKRKITEIDQEITRQKAVMQNKLDSSSLVKEAEVNKLPAAAAKDTASTVVATGKINSAPSIAKASLLVPPAVKPALDTTLQAEAAARRKARILDLLINAQQAIITKNFDSARVSYKEVLSLQPSAYQSEFAKREIKSLDLELAKKGGSVTHVKEHALNKDSSLKQTAAPVASRVFPATNNSPTASDNQTDKAYDTSNRGNLFTYAEISRKILSQPTKIYFADSSNSIKMVCEDIAFNNKEAYIKLLIKNKNSDYDFVGDDLKLTYIKNYGILLKSRPVNITGNQNVPSEKETELIFVTHAVADVEPNEIFILEIEDKSKQTKLSIHIPGDVYNQLKK